MERNANDNFNSDTFGSTGASGTTGTGGTGAGANDQGQGRFQSAKDVAADKLSAVKDKASNLSASLADKLDAGADRLRQRAQGGAYAGAGDSGSSAIAGDERLAKVNDAVASGMQNTARWLREGDLRATIEDQVRTNPGRTLLVALGVGYVLGKAFRGNNR